MNFLMRKKHEIRAWHLVIAYIVLSAFFNNTYLQSIIPNFGGLAIALFSLLIILNFKFVINNCKGKSITSYVSKFILLYLFSIAWAYVLWGQPFWSSMITMGSLRGMLPIVTYVVLYKNDVSSEIVSKAIVVLCVIYSVCYLLGLFTMPYPAFGLSTDSSVDYSSMLDQRGVIRLSIPGADFVVMTIFLVLTYYRKENKKGYLFLLPLLFILLLRGTRTPFFVTILVGMIYYLWGIRRKWIVLFLAIFLYAGAVYVYSLMLDSTSDNAVVKYVQMTSNQIERSKTIEEDIRIEMARYIFTEFNDANPFRYILGNGVPGYEGKYADLIERLGNNKAYYPVDTAFTAAFTFFGIIGLLLYALLLVAVIKTKIPGRYMWVKLYIYYLYVISPTNSILVYSTLTLAIALYVMNREHEKSLMMYAK